MINMNARYGSYARDMHMSLMEDLKDEFLYTWKQIYDYYNKLSIDDIKTISTSFYLSDRNTNKDNLIRRLLPSEGFITDLIRVQEENDQYHDVDVQTTDVLAIDADSKSNIWRLTNQYLITGTPLNVPTDVQSYIDRHIDRMDNLFDVVPPLDKEILVFRGDSYINPQEGDIITYKQIVSTSIFLEVVLEAYYDPDNNVSIMAIILPKGMKVLFHPAELQILLPRGVQLQVKKIQTSPWYAFGQFEDLRTIYCRALPSK